MGISRSLSILVVALVAGCATKPQTELEDHGDEASSSESDESSDGEEHCVETSPMQVRSCEPHDSDPQIDVEQFESLGAGHRALAIDLYHALREGDAKDQGFSISPYSLRVAFGMLYGGTVEPARSELESTLHLTLGDAQHQAFNWLDAELAARNLPAIDDADPVVLQTANSVWLQASISDRVEPDYLDLLASHYDAGVFLADFEQQLEPARLGINSWVEGRTQGLIPELFAPGLLSTLTKFVLVNAVYLKAPWLTPFNAEYTASESFTRLDGSIVDVQMMLNPQMSVGLATGADWEAVAIPLRGEALELIAIMPYDFAAFETALDLAALDAILDAEFDEGVIELSLPRFELESKLELSDELKALGMPTPFIDAHSFEAMVHDEPIVLDPIVHTTVIKAEEGGIEAAAAAGVVGNTPPSIPPSFRVDRPFMLAIYDRPSATLLFLGRVLDPS